MVARAMIVFALSYWLWPLDLIPDTTPYFGYVDDFCVTLISLLIVRLIVPAEVMNDYWPSRAVYKRSHERSETWPTPVALIVMLTTVLAIACKAAYSPNVTEAFIKIEAAVDVLLFD